MEYHSRHQLSQLHQSLLEPVALPEPMTIYCQLDPWEHKFKFSQNSNSFTEQYAFENAIS